MHSVADWKNDQICSYINSQTLFASLALELDELEDYSGLSRNELIKIIVSKWPQNPTPPPPQTPKPRKKSSTGQAASPDDATPAPPYDVTEGSVIPQVGDAMAAMYYHKWNLITERDPKFCFRHFEPFLTVGGINQKNMKREAVLVAFQVHVQSLEFKV